MAFIRSADRNYHTAVPGEHAVWSAEYKDGVRWVELATGETGTIGYMAPLAATQRRAMQLADVTGSEITMSRGDHFAPLYSGDSAAWNVMPAAHTEHVPETRGWVVVVSSPDGIIGYQHARHYFRTWPKVVAFLREHFPHDAITVTDDETTEEVNATLLEGVGETVGDFGDGDPTWAGITQVGDKSDAPWFGREENQYGQNLTYRFANERQARSWLDAIVAANADTADFR